jgi:hypothetical protein
VWFASVSAELFLCRYVHARPSVPRPPLVHRPQITPFPLLLFLPFPLLSAWALTLASHMHLPCGILTYTQQVLWENARLNPDTVWHHESDFLEVDKDICTEALLKYCEAKGLGDPLERAR